MDMNLAGSGFDKKAFVEFCKKNLFFCVETEVTVNCRLCYYNSEQRRLDFKSKRLFLSYKMKNI